MGSAQKKLEKERKKEEQKAARAAGRAAASGATGGQSKAAEDKTDYSSLFGTLPLNRSEKREGRCVFEWWPVGGDGMKIDLIQTVSPLFLQKKKDFLATGDNCGSGGQTRFVEGSS